MGKILVIAVIVLACSGGSAVAGLVAYWPLDGDAADLSGNGNNGTISGNVAPTADRFGTPNGAMHFPGAPDDYINVGNDLSIQLTGAMTITAWVKLDSSSPHFGHNNSRILSKLAITGSGVDWSYSLNIEANKNGVQNPASFMVGKPGNAGLVSLNDDEPLPTDQWVHIAGVYTPGKSLEIYLNGELISSTTDGIPPSQYSSGPGYLCIGSFQGVFDCGWYGDLDEIRLYDEALTQKQIQSIMGGSQASNPSPASGANRVPPDTLLSWDPPDPCNLVETPAQYIVYFDPNETLVTNGDSSVCFGQQSQTQFDPGELALMSTYYWRVDVVDPNHGEPVIYPGVVWKFTTIAPKAGLVFPADGATGTARNAVLQWDPGFGAISHKLYFGTDETLVASGDDSAYIGTLEAATFDPELEWQKQYFWRVDEVFGNGAPEPGDVWSFTTGTPVCEYELPGDIDKNCIVDLADFAIMAGNWLTCNLTNDDCP